MLLLNVNPLVPTAPPTQTLRLPAGDTGPGVDAHSHVVITAGDTSEQVGVQDSRSHVSIAGYVKPSVGTKDAVGDAVNVILERSSADSRVEAPIGSSARVGVQKRASPTAVLSEALVLLKSAALPTAVFPLESLV